jgi:predicted CoA-substrate-specific enzyme activase
MAVRIGLDIGSTSVNAVVLDQIDTILEEHYLWCHGRPFRVAERLLRELEHRYPRIAEIALTGSGGETMASLVGGRFVNEIVAQTTSVIRLHPEVCTIIEIGGEDSKLITIAEKDGRRLMEEFTMNNLCAAGTGSFLDQQARRIGVSIEGEFGELSLKSDDPPRIAGRCSVFAKSDMIHLQQVATPVHDIVAGLCFAVARNFRSHLAKGRPVAHPVSFQGGVAANTGVVRAFREVFELDGDQMIIPKHHASMGALGALFAGEAKDALPYRGTAELNTLIKNRTVGGAVRAPLKMPESVIDKTVYPPPTSLPPLPVSLGLDIGSLSTNLVLIDEENRVVARRYLPTAGRPLEAMRRGLAEISKEVGDRVVVKAAGTTGSGRYLTGYFIGADEIHNEITAQATAAIAHDPTVDTIFEIGGQDSKYIRIDEGTVTDFEMNKVCAAGTGSFLEEQAEKLGIDIIGEFQDLAMSSKNPYRLGDRCTVFIEADLNTGQQQGALKEDLVAGLAYSIVLNYLRKVVETRRIGKRIFFQGGVTNNAAVVSAFEKVTGRSITVPPYFDVTGAIGAAIIAREKSALKGKTTSDFKGFEACQVPYSMSKFNCTDCANQCEVRTVAIEGDDNILYIGDRCDKYGRHEKKRRSKVPNLFRERLHTLLGDFRDAPDEDADGRPVIGIPRQLMVFWQQFPFWRTFFEDLGFRVILSRPTDRRLITRALGMISAETCFPVESLFGHVQDLLDRKVDRIFLPFIVDNRGDEDNPTVNYNCPWIQTYPYMIKSALKDRPDDESRLMIPVLHFRYFERALVPDLTAYMEEEFGTSREDTRRAIRRAEAAQMAFEAAIRDNGRRALADLNPDMRTMVVLGRPYNTGDPLINLDLVDKLIRQGVFPVPLDYLPLEREDVFDDYSMMYWPNGQKIIAGARLAASDERLDAVYIGNFRCGPDSFLQHYVTREMGVKPLLFLEVDEHSADAGMITRIEAFLDSRGSHRTSPPTQRTGRRRLGSKPVADSGRTLWFPYMNDNAYAVAAASRACGVDAWVLPKQDDTDVELGREYLTGKECFPMICTTGSFLKKLREPGIDPKKMSFFMPDHAGPCRFGQYNKLQRILFDRLGYSDVEITSPTNEDSYAGLSGGKGVRFRLAVLRGIYAVDLLRKFRQETKPYEKISGDVDRIYRTALDMVIRSVETGARRMPRLLREIGEMFSGIPLADGPRKPVVLVVGEIFMRDNAFCSGNVIGMLEGLGSETLVAPFLEWLTYSSVRWERDSRWKGDRSGLIKGEAAKILSRGFLHTMEKSVEDLLDLERDVDVEEMLNHCGPYVHRDYDGDPALALGTAAALADSGIAGVVNILPFTCMPGPSSARLLRRSARIMKTSPGSISTTTVRISRP